MPSSQRMYHNHVRALLCHIFEYDISALKNIEKFELPKFVQDVSLLVKANGSRGFFIGIIENISKETINDITMFVDKVMGDNR